MSAHSAVAPSTRLNHTILDARAFYRGLEVWFAAPGFQTILTNSENEIAFSRIVRCLGDDLLSLENAELPVQARIGINSLRSFLDSFINRWNWDRVIGPDGDAFLAEAWNLWVDRRRLYFSAVRSYVETYAAGETSERPEEGYFHAAKDAEKEGIPPSLPFIRSKEDLKPLQEAWIFSPYLGPEFPTSTPDDFVILKTALQDIEEGLRGTHLETSGSKPPEATALPLPPRGYDKTPTAPASGIATPPPSDATTDCGSLDRNNERKKMLRDQVFISYSHRDKRFLDELQTHLKPYLRTRAITAWSDQQIQPSSKWFDEIKAALAKTSVAVMLVTPNFLGSDFIHDHELGPLLKEAEAGGVKVLWLLIRDCSWKETPLKDYQALAPTDKPFAGMTSAKRDTAWRKVCEELKQAVSHP
ncbi:MAG: toll/interleukin-1 receptor domain-containing protein [Isosphaeraceae bacterium]|jgi:hypothetical protein